MNTASAETRAMPLAPSCPERPVPALPTMAEEPSHSQPNPAGEQAEDVLQRLPVQSPAALSVSQFLGRLLESHLLTAAEVDKSLAHHPRFLENDTAGLMEALIRQGLLTEYQGNRLLAGQTFGLVLGNYRIVEPIGAGGMGVVYKAEHVHMKRAVAIKVLVSDDDGNSVFLQRFYSEMQATAVLSHPNIVLAFDAGEMASPPPRHEVLRYLVMEYVPGKNLEQYVMDHGPLPVARACDYIRQAASGLQHAYEHGLVHRDIKPSNLLLTPQNQVKILDFGLARLCRRRHTEAHIMLGSVDYMAPEQARDARSVDIRADIYGLGGTLYWLLSGRKPFPGDRPVLEELLARQREAPQPLRKPGSDIPLELEAIVYQMMALDPGDRYPTPRAIMTALSAYLEPGVGSSPGTRISHQPGSLQHTVPEHQVAIAGDVPLSKQVHRVLVVSQATSGRASWRAILEAQGLECAEAGHAADACELLKKSSYDLVLIDAALPDGVLELCSHLRAEPATTHLKVIVLAAETKPEWLTTAQEAGADDCISQTAQPQELAARIQTFLRLKESEDRADSLADQLSSVNRQLEETLRMRDADLCQAQDVLIFAMAKMAELRGLETGAHLLRMQGYVRVLAEEAMRLPTFAGRIDDAFVRMLEHCVLLHDIGKVAIPDHILLKPGKFDAEERSVMESHTIAGAEILAAVARQQGASLAFVQMARDIARYHHECYNGSGYPDHLAGEAIPLAARIVTIADVYDALRSKLVYKPGLAHEPSKRLILEAKPGQFDPALLVAFCHCEANFEQVFAQTKD